jgi:hypothetical protein
MTEHEATDKQTAENGTEACNLKRRFEPGGQAGPGRPRGSRNRFSGTLKQDVLAAYQRRGGLKWLTSLPDRQFLALVEKVLAKDLAAELKLKPEDEPRAINVVMWMTYPDGRPPERLPDGWPNDKLLPQPSGPIHGQ